MTWNGTSQIAALLLVLSTLSSCMGFPDGAPDYVCDDMLPFHKGSKQLNGTDSPYQLVQEKAAFQPNDSITVTLYSKEAHFRGFMVKALDEHDNQVGLFQRGAIYKPVEDCSAATHVSKHKKEIVKMLWKAPGSRGGQVHFKATVVHNYRLFYTDLMSKTMPRSHLSRRFNLAFNKPL